MFKKRLIFSKIQFNLLFEKQHLNFDLSDFNIKFLFLIVVRTVQKSAFPKNLN